jgi:hypothetical protein
MLTLSGYGVFHSLEDRFRQLVIEYVLLHYYTRAHQGVPKSTPSWSEKKQCSAQAELSVKVGPGNSAGSRPFCGPCLQEPDCAFTGTAPFRARKKGFKPILDCRRRNPPGTSFAMPNKRREPAFEARSTRRASSLESFSTKTA